MVDRWLRAYFSMVKTEALHGVFLSKARDLEHELSVGAQHIKYTPELLSASNLRTSSRQRQTLTQTISKSNIVMAAYFAFAPTEEQLEELLAASEADPDLGASAALLQRAGWELWVVPAGSCGYVERLLRRAGVAATVYSNLGRLEPGRGLVLEKLDASSPYHSASVGVDKSAVIRHALHVVETVACAGDGPPDLQLALLVRPALRLVRGFLADALRQRGEAFRPFSRWREIARNWHEECSD
jgi:2-hydroxy-3-keto-5-methylthiopentenyl-1-phosphate phosphatase